MQIVAQSLLVLRITGNSAVALGTVSLAQASAFFFFAPMGGAFRATGTTNGGCCFAPKRC